jgi:hypothetical protein
MRRCLRSFKVTYGTERKNFKKFSALVGVQREARTPPLFRVLCAPVRSSTNKPLFYNGTDADGLSTWKKYNGNISAMKWKSIGAPTGALGQKSYAYRYDKSGRLEKASYGMKNAAGWSAGAGALNESMEYDHNGNITKLQRAQRKHEFINDLPAYSSETIDNLTYPPLFGVVCAPVRSSTNKPTHVEVARTREVVAQDQSH